MGRHWQSNHLVEHSIIFPLFWLSYSARDCTLTLYDIHFPLSAVLSLQYGIHFSRSCQYYHHHGRLSPHDLTQIYLTLFPLFLLSIFVSVTHKHTHIHNYTLLLVVQLYQRDIFAISGNLALLISKDRQVTATLSALTLSRYERLTPPTNQVITSRTTVLTETICSLSTTL